VEFLVQRFGQQQLKAILRDLGDGSEINAAIEKHTIPMAQLETDFAAFARERAQKLAPGLDFEKPDGGNNLAGLKASENSGSTNSPAPPRRRRIAHDPEALTAWVATHPTNFYALMEQARRAVAEKKFEEARPPLEKLLKLYPDQTGEESAYPLLAATCQALGETNGEWQTLTHWAERDDEAIDAYRRLMELASTNQDWPVVALNAERFLAVNPLTPQPYRFLAQASEHLGQDRSAVQAYRALLQLDPPDPAETHFRLARVLHRLGDPGAKRQVLEALEEAPRYQAALQLLLELNRGAENTALASPSGEVGH
jgi:tetratricopeptide (TPR) repeat protein